MVLIAALIATEKLLPWKAVVNRGIAVLLVALGIAVALVPEDVPGLTEPDSAAAAHGMESMGIGGGSMEDESMGGESMGGGTMGRGSMQGHSMEGMKPPPAGGMKHEMQP
jgi:hypothetical protein